MTEPDPVRPVQGRTPAGAPTPRERRRAVLFFVATLVSVYLVYGYQWMGGDPLADAQVALGSAQFAVGLMAILLAHEMGHYLVARGHGFRLSLPYFLPFPWAFGTLGAIIRLRSLPPSRSALLEMGAAGPISGLVVAVLALALGLSGTVEHLVPQVVLAVPDAAAVAVESSSWIDQQAWLMAALDAIDSALVALGVGPDMGSGDLPMMILANPPAMDLLGDVLLGAPPGRYASLSPLAMAGWVGCLLTAINLLPIGQLDGGHIANALFPRQARLVSRVGVGLLIVSGLVWGGWAFWGIVLVLLQAWRSLPVPERPPLSARARIVAAVAVLAFALSFMPRPLEMEALHWTEVEFLDPDGAVIPDATLRSIFETPSADGASVDGASGDASVAKPGSGR